MAKFDDKISHLINQQAPDFVLDDHPYFLEFVKAYYSFMESAELVLTNIGDPDVIQLETQTGTISLLQLEGTNKQSLDSGDNILLEDSSVGDFINGETITGSTSGATATILVEDIDGNSKLYISAQNKFIEGETITGSTSGATADISTYRANPVQNIQELLDYPDPDKTIQGFLTKFRNAFLQSIPDNLNSAVDKRKLIKNIKSLYRSKGTTRATEVFFKLLFNENAEVTLPKDNMLRVSDGKWDTQKVLRCVEVGSSEATHLIGQTITQANVAGNGSINEATAIVENVFKFTIGGITVVELVLGEDSIVGTFVAGQNITGTDNTDEDVLVTCTLEGVITEKTITNDGALYSADDAVTITGGGNGASIQVDTVGSGSIENIFISSAGSGYAIGDVVNFSTGNASAKVSVVNGGIAPESDTPGMDATDHIVLEDETQRGDPYTGNKIVQESGTGSEDITDVRIIDAGNGYTSLPTLTITSSGSGANLKAHGGEIGRILSLKTIELGNNYDASPTPATLTLPLYLLVIGASGNFTVGETVSATGSDGSTVITATVSSWDSDTGVLKVSSPSGTFGTDVTITGGTSGETGTIKVFDLATATSTVGVVATTDGSYINQDGHISETTMVVQDSLLYQDYSYIIKVGRSITDWRDSYKSTLHGAGFYFQGEVAIRSQLDMKLRNVTGINTGVVEVIQGVIKTLFSTILGRRLGTSSDGTTLRTNPLVGVNADLDDSTIEHFTANTRDVTLNTAYTLKFLSTPTFVIRGTTTRFGTAYAGPRMGNVNLFGTGLFSGRGVVQSGTVGGQATSFYTQEGDAVVSTAQYKFGGSSMFFDGTGDFLEVNAPGSSTMNGDFTVEMFYRSSIATTDIAALWDNGSFAGNGIAIYLNNNQLLITKNNGTIAQASAGLSNDTWHHIAYVRSGSTATIYVDGTSKVSGSISTDDYSSYAYRIGTAIGSDTGSINMGPAFIDEFRLSKIARYTSNFTAPTQAFEDDSDQVHLFHFDDRYVTPMTLADWNRHLLIGTKTSFDGTVVQYGEIAQRNLKTYLALPTEIQLSY